MSEMTVREAQEKWLKLLETGDYPQTLNGHLRDVEGYCCLGIAAEHVFDIDSCVTGGNLKEFVYSFDSQSSDSVFMDAQRLGLYSNSGETSCDENGDTEIADYISKNFGEKFTYNGVELTAINDNGLGFKEIAQVIREFPKAYFSEGYGYE